MQQEPKEDEVVIDDPNGEEKPVEKPEEQPEDRTPPESSVE